MQRFFLDFNSLDQFTFSLRSLGESLSCPHCHKSNQLRSHGRVYKQRSMTQRIIVGKRVFCSNRYQHQGCGRTVQLYVAQAIPGLRYSTSEAYAFVSALLKGTRLEEAYLKATNQSDPRQAWRWLKKLEHNLSSFRCQLTRAVLEKNRWKLRLSRRLRLLLSTFQALFAALPHCPCQQFQWQQQHPFL